MSWEDLEKAKKHTGSYVKLEPGADIEGVFVGDPYVFYKSRDFEDKTEYPEPGSGRRMRFRIHFVIKDGEDLIPKLMEQGTMFADTLYENKVENGLERFYKVKRTGEGLNTSYSMFAKDELTEDQKKFIVELNLPDLSKAADFNPEDWD